MTDNATNGTPPTDLARRLREAADRADRRTDVPALLREAAGAVTDAANVRAAALEEAAKVCDGVVQLHSDTAASFRQSPPRKILERDAVQRASGAHDCAHSVRALSPSRADEAGGKG